MNSWDVVLWPQPTKVAIQRIAHARLLGPELGMGISREPLLCIHGATLRHPASGDIMTYTARAKPSVSAGRYNARPDRYHN